MILERLASEMCVNHLKAMKSAYVPDEEVKCRATCDGYSFDCERYKSVRICQVPIRQGRFFVG